MTKNLKYFMRQVEEKVVNAPGPESFKDEEGNVIQLEIKVLDHKTIQDINNKYVRRSIATDKSGSPLVANGEVVWKVERDPATANRHIMVEALQYPNLKDPDLMNFYNCHLHTDMPLNVFPKADEYSHVFRMVMTVLGLRDAPTDSQELEDAKN